MVISDHTVHFGTRQVQPLGNVAHHLGRYVAHLVLDGVQQRQQRSLNGFVGVYKLMNV